MNRPENIRNAENANGHSRLPLGTEAERQLLYRALASCMGNGFLCLADSGFNLLFADGNGLTGLVPQGAPNPKNIAELFGGNAFTQLLPALQEAFEGRTGSFHITAGKGSYQGEAIPLPYTESGLRQVLLPVRNVTEQAAAENQVIQADLLTQTLLRSLPDTFVALTGPDGILKFTEGRALQNLSPAVESRFKTGAALHEALGTETGEKLQAVVRHVLNTGIAAGTEVLISGHTFHCLINPLPAKNGSLKTVLISGRNISPDQAVREQLQRSRDLLNAVMHDSDDALLLRRPHEALNISCNRQAAAFFEAEGNNQIMGIWGIDRLLNALTEAETAALKLQIEQTGEYRLTGQFVSLRGNPRWGALTIKRLLLGAEAHWLIRISDVQEQKTASDRVVESESRHTDLFYNNPQPMWIYDTQTRRVSEVNDAALNLYGYTRPEFTGMLLDSIRPAADLVRFRASVEDASHNEGYNKGAWKHLKKNGELMEVEINSHPLPDEQFGTNRRLVLVTDQTARLKAERENENHRRYLRRIIDTDPNLIFVKDADGAYQMVNKAMAAVLGNSPEYIEGRLEADLLRDPKKAESYRKQDLRVLETNITTVNEDVFRNPRSGKDHYLITTKSPITGLNGQPCILGVCVDITERITTENELRESRQLFEEVFNNSADALFLLDNTAGYIENGNQQAAQLFAFDNLQQLIGMETQKFHEMLGTANELEQINNILRAGGTYSAEKEYTDTKGQTFWGAIAIRNVGTRRNAYSLLRITDISRRKQYEDKLKASVTEKEVLIKEIHHRVKNNMAVISGLLHLQSNYISDPAVLEIFRESQNRIKGMALIHEHLYQGNNFTGIDFGKYLSSLVSHISRSYLRNGQVTINLEADNVTLNLTDAVPCGLIVNELVSNSCKHAFPDGRKGKITVAFRKEGEYYKLSVSDDGVGMPAETAPKSDRLGKSSNGQNGSHKTGSLGLTLINELSKQIKGTLSTSGTMSADNEGGTSFTVTFKEKYPAEPALP